MNKPKHVLHDIWQQHLQWMRLMAEGQLTLDPYQRPINKTGDGRKMKKVTQSES